MPGMDGRGSLGLGSRTGRRLGMCVGGANVLKYGNRAGRGLRRRLGIGMGTAGLEMGPSFGLGLGRTLGRGIGCGLLLGVGMGYVCMRGLRRNPDQDGMTEKEILQVQKERLESKLEALNQRLESLVCEDQ